MHRADSLLPQALRKRGLYEEAQAALTLHRARAWLQIRFSQHPSIYTPRSLKDGILTITAENSLALQEGQLVAAELLAHLKTDQTLNLESIRFSREV